MGKVVFNMTMSLDGFVAGPNDLEYVRAIPAPGVTHLGSRVVK